MAQNGAFTREMSIKMNKALDAIGVNDNMIQIRRNSYLQIESNDTAIRTCEFPFYETPFYFGSQSEGTTTIGLASDIDYVFCTRTIRVVHNLPRLNGDHIVLQMIKSSNPGYCFLRDTFQMFKADHKHGTPFVKNSFQFYNDWFGETLQMEGPAIFHQAIDGDTINCVWAFPCISWPAEVSESFLSNQSTRAWPSGDLADQILKSECFVVPKGSEVGENSDIEWRLSFSCGERLLMFDLNVIQIRCYILMKYIKTTFLDRIAHCQGIVSSYVCKTVLFHIISQTQNSVWIEGELLANLNLCLGMLRKCIDEQNCPHFIMATHNLLARKLDSHSRVMLSSELYRLIVSNGRALFDIEIDGFGKLLQSAQEPTRNVEVPKMLIYNITNQLTASWLKAHNEWDQLQMLPGFDKILFKSKIGRLIEFCQFIDNADQRIIDSVKIAMCKLSAMLGSCLASNDFKERRGLSHEAFQWLLLSVQCSDTSSSYLKLASILLTDGDLECTNTVLDDISNKLSSEEIDSICLCKRLSARSSTHVCRDAFLNKKSFVQILRENIGFCITFRPCEMTFCPKELQFEMFRTTLSDQSVLPSGHECFNNWLYCAVISPKPFLYFMQYKLYTQRCMPAKRLSAYLNLLFSARDRQLADMHRETTLNLVGQCLEQEGLAVLALDAYQLSLIIQPNYNAARILLCCNLYKQFTLRR